MTCTNQLELRDAPCGDEGQLCESCFRAEAARWAQYFGQDYGTREEKRARLQAMKPFSIQDNEPFPE